MWSVASKGVCVLPTHSYVCLTEFRLRVYMKDGSVSTYNCGMGRVSSMEESLSYRVLLYSNCIKFEHNLNLTVPSRPPRARCND